jgi:hypothetical protein
LVAIAIIAIRKGMLLPSLTWKRPAWHETRIFRALS